MKVNIAELSSWAIWNSSSATFIVSQSHAFEHPNVTVIPNDYAESQHYIAACDLVITKAGWGTVSEAISSGKPVFIINRNGMQEDSHTIRYLQERNLCKLIEWEDVPVMSIEPSLLSEQQRKRRQIIPSLDHKSEILSSIMNLIEKNNHERRKETR
nr:glycosyltransferase [Paenibacillus sp. SYP-B3998]